MNTTLFSQSLVASLVIGICLGLGVSAVHAEDGYSIKLKVVPEGGEPQEVEVSGVNLDWHDSVKLPVLLPHSQTPATVELDFDVSAMTVGVTIEDLMLTSSTESRAPVKREYFRGARYFKWGEEATICKTATETVSLIVMAPAPEAVKEGEAAELDPNVIPAAEVAKLETNFYVSQGTIRGEVYNPGGYFIDEIYVRAVAEPQDGFDGIDRVYMELLHLKPLTADVMQIDARLPPLPDGFEYKVSIEKATGRKEL